MLTNSQLRRVPGLEKAYRFARTKLHPDGFEQWQRVVMNRETDRLIGELDVEHSSALEISGLKWKDRGFASYTISPVTTSARMRLRRNLTSLSLNKSSSI